MKASVRYLRSVVALMAFAISSAFAGDVIKLQPHNGPTSIKLQPVDLGRIKSVDLTTTATIYRYAEIRRDDLRVQEHTAPKAMVLEERIVIDQDGNRVR